MKLTSSLIATTLSSPINLNALELQYQMEADLDKHYYQQVIIDNDLVLQRPTLDELNLYGNLTELEINDFLLELEGLSSSSIDY